MDLQDLPAHEYPWRPINRSGVVLADGFRTIDQDRPLHDQLDDQLTPTGVAPLSEREPVLAVGSNRCAHVLRLKFGRAGVSQTVPVARCVTANLTVGHSAHVSRRGYLAAAPLHSPGSTERLLITWLDADQLAALDRTEPNYRRSSLPWADYPVSLIDDRQRSVLDQVSLYVTERGLLGDGSGPVRLAAQHVLHRMLSAVERLADLDWHRPTAEVTTLLARREIGRRVEQAIEEAGLSLPGRLDPLG